MRWDPAIYLEYADHRLRPGIELLSRVSMENPSAVLDVGCGTGHLTKLMSARWTRARIAGIDASTEMLSTARSVAPQVEWIQSDITSWEPEDPVDVVYSNAVLHWIGDHAILFRRLASWTRGGGTLAVQMPNNWRDPTHTIPAQILDEPEWPDTARNALMRDRVREPAFYYSLLDESFAEIDMWTTTYHQILSGPDPVLTWVEGSVLRPVLAALEEGRREEFRSRCADAYRLAYPPEADGITILPFTRFFLVANGSLRTQ